MKILAKKRRLPKRIVFIIMRQKQIEHTNKAQILDPVVLSGKEIMKNIKPDNKLYICSIDNIDI
jgi:hypothetical protein